MQFNRVPSVMTIIETKLYDIFNCALSGGFSSSLKRSFTLPRHPLFNLTNSENKRGQNRVKKAKRSTSEMKSDLISSPSKSRTTASSVRNLLTRVVKQISAKTNGGSNSNKCDRNVEERIAEWKRRFTAEPGRVPGVIGMDYSIYCGKKFSIFVVTCGLKVGRLKTLN